MPATEKFKVYDICPSTNQKKKIYGLLFAQFFTERV